MKKIAGMLTIPAFLGLAMAQDTRTTPQSASTDRMGTNGQTWTGILVDSRCTSSGMMSRSSSDMPKSTAMSQATPAGNDSLINRTTPAQSGRDVNTTDRNTSGVADRVGATSGNTAGNRDMARTSSSSDRASNSSDLSRGTATDRGTSADLNRNSADGRTNADMTRRTPTDMARSTTAASTGNPTDTQTGNSPPSSVAANGNGGNWDSSCFVSPSTSSFVLQLQDGRTMKIDAAGSSKIASKLQSSGRVSTKNKVFRVKVTGSAEGDTISPDRYSDVSFTPPGSNAASGKVPRGRFGYVSIPSCSQRKFRTIQQLRSWRAVP